MKVLITGNRNMRDISKVVEVIKRMKKEDTVISGMSGRVDTAAETAAICMGIGFIGYEANWGKEGNKAGPVRNSMMLMEKPNIVIAFVPELLGAGRGTTDMVRKAVAKGIEVRIIKTKGGVL